MIEKILDNKIIEAKKLLNFKNKDVSDIKVIKTILNSNEKFKSLIARNISHINPNYINTNNTLSGIMYIFGYNTSKVKNNIQNIFTESINGANILKDNVISYFNTIDKNYYFIGQKYEVLNSKLKIDKELKNLGINLNTLTDCSINFNFEKKKDDILKRLEEKLKDISISNNQIYLLNDLNNENTNDSIKLDIINSIIWPKIKEEIRDSISLMIVSEKLFKKDFYFNKLEKFANDNEVTVSSLVYLLQYSPKYFSHFKNFKKIEPHIPDIINTYNKYSEYANASIFISKFYINTIIEISNKYLNQTDKETLMKEKFLFIQDKDLNLHDLSEKFNLSITEKIDTIKRKP